MGNSIRLRDLPDGYVECCGVARCLAAYPACLVCHKPAPGSKTAPPAITTGEGRGSGRSDTRPAAPGQETARKTTQHKRGKWAPYRSYTEKRAAEWLATRYRIVEYEPLSVAMPRQHTASGRVRRYTPDFVASRPDVDVTAFEVKSTRNDVRNSTDAFRRIATDAKEALERWGVADLRLLVWDGERFTEQEV